MAQTLRVRLGKGPLQDRLQAVLIDLFQRMIRFGMKVSGEKGAKLQAEVEAFLPGQEPGPGPGRIMGPGRCPVSG